MLGTLSEPHRGQMSHICDISALRVNSQMLSQMNVSCLIMYYIIFKNNL